MTRPSLVGFALALLAALALCAGCATPDPLQVQSRRRFFDSVAPVASACWAGHYDPPLTPAQLALRLQVLVDQDAAIRAQEEALRGR